MRAKKLVLIMFAAASLLFQGCSCETWATLWGGDPQEECASHWKWKEREPTKKVIFSPCETPAMSKSVMAYPVGGEKGRAVSLEKMAPKEVQAGTSFDYRIKVTNLTDRQLHNVVIKEHLTEGLRIEDSSPKFQKIKDDIAYWNLGILEGKASEMITITAVAEGRDFVTSCAEVSFDSLICAGISIVEPKLRLAKIAPAQSLMCDRIPIRYIVTNNGTGYACDIEIKDTFPQGLMTSRGENQLVFNIDSLGPGQSKEFEVMLDATRTGVFASKAILTSSVGGMVESDLISTTVNQPVLSINESCPASQYIGRPLTYEISVSNKGDAIARDTVIEAVVPEGAQFSSATDGGLFTHSSPGKVTWNIGILQPNDSKEVGMTLSPQKSGTFLSEATAKAYCADSVSASCQTTLAGIPGILLEVVDQSDPVEVGQNGSYVITVTNQGSATATNIRISCMLEEQMEYISSSGQTMGTEDGGRINFAPLASLAPKAQARWRVNIKAAGPGDVRFKTMLESDQLTRSVEETEATMFYE